MAGAERGVFFGQAVGGDRAAWWPVDLPGHWVPGVGRVQPAGLMINVDS